MDFREYIETRPGGRSGKPLLKGTRITVLDVLELLASGQTNEEILADFPELSLEQIRACLAFVVERERITYRSGL